MAVERRPTLNLIPLRSKSIFTSTGSAIELSSCKRFLFFPKPQFPSLCNGEVGLNDLKLQTLLSGGR